MYIRQFQKNDQARVQEVILEGLKEYFGSIDHSLNPDVYNIDQFYLQKGITFLVAEIEGEIVATGGLKKTDESDMPQIVRISVHKDYRRKGIAKEMTLRLIDFARKKGYKRILVETTKTWQAPRTLYNSMGFKELYEDEEDVYMVLSLK